MQIVEQQSRFFEVEPLEGESISHFLGRFRRTNYLTTGGLGKLTRLGAVIGRWEKFYFSPFPKPGELEALAVIVGVEVERLMEMLPVKGMTLQPKPIMLCAACYGENPCHRIEWQFKQKQGCDRHQLTLLSRCPNCQTPFSLPSTWVQGECSHCFLPFGTMVKHQRSILPKVDRGKMRKTTRKEEG